jgi:hypothetical protein
LHGCTAIRGARRNRYHSSHSHTSQREEHHSKYPQYNQHQRRLQECLDLFHLTPHTRYIVFITSCCIRFTTKRNLGNINSGCVYTDVGPRFGFAFLSNACAKLVTGGVRVARLRARPHAHPLTRSHPHAHTRTRSHPHAHTYAHGYACTHTHTLRSRVFHINPSESVSDWEQTSCRLSLIW